uniref:PDZ domain-containing protein n=1 Tax=Alexandrium monilatum TaxID=311494 RepID=A0A7S4VFB0_9DINO|mmetsp:Transcript_104772/g.312996  ORF Transcript_104772/g.312996 Transcript_104772/m.312996 type:complete len:701 (+) Transcript_104772:93-2195(+)
MDAWFKAKAEELAQAAQQHVSELQQSASQLQQSASQLTQGALEGALQRTGVLSDDAGNSGHKDLQFGNGPLGFRLEGTLVVAVQEGQQAEALGLQVGDRLVAVDGYVVPVFEAGDLEGEQRAKRLIKKWMKEMPRPATLTFAPLTPLEADGERAADGAEEATVAKAPEAVEPVGQAPADALAPEASDLLDQAATEAWGLDVPLTDPALEEPTSALQDVAPGSSLEPAVSGPVEASPGGDPLPAADEVESEGAFEVGEETEEGCFEAECTAEGVPIGGPPAEASMVPPARDALPPELLSGKVQDIQAELQHELGENRKLTAALQEARQSLAQMRSNLETERQQRMAHQKRVSELQKREKVLADEVTRLSQALQTAVPNAAEIAQQKAAAAEAQVAELQEAVSRLTQENEALQARSEAAESRATAAESEVGSLRPQLERFSHVHETELELLRAEHLERDQRQRQDFEDRTAALEQRAASELEQARQEAREAQSLVEEHRKAAEEANVDAQAAAVEARAARQAEAEAREAALEMARQTGASDPLEEGSDDEVLHKPASAPAVGSKDAEDASALHARIELLEARCCKLQRKLRAQRGQPGADNLDAAESGGSPDWEARLVSTLGPLKGRIVVLICGMVDAKLRRFTERLLKHTLWLYVFYAHLLVLYAIGASCYAQSGMYSAAPLDSIPEHMSTAAGANSKGAG